MMREIPHFQNGLGDERDHTVPSSFGRASNFDDVFLASVFDNQVRDFFIDSRLFEDPPSTPTKHVGYQAFEFCLLAVQITWRDSWHLSYHGHVNYHGLVNYHGHDSSVGLVCQPLAPLCKKKRS